MAKIVHTNDGQILHWTFPTPPSNAIVYDSHTNPTLYSEVYADPSAYSVVAGVLTRGGVPVSINPPCEDCQTLDSIDGISDPVVRKVLQLFRDRPGFQRG